MIEHTNVSDGWDGPGAQRTFPVLQEAPSTTTPLCPASLLDAVASGMSRGVQSQGGAPLVCLEFCLLTVGDLMAKMNWID